MKRQIFNWLLLVFCGALVHVCFRYWAGNFQGYLTFPVGGAEYGLAHIKGSTVWVSGRGQFTGIPPVLILGCFLASVAALIFAVRRVYKNSICE